MKVKQILRFFLHIVKQKTIENLFTRCQEFTMEYIGLLLYKNWYFRWKTLSKMKTTHLNLEDDRDSMKMTVFQ